MWKTIYIDNDIYNKKSCPNHFWTTWIFKLKCLVNNKICDIYWHFIFKNMFFWGQAEITIMCFSIIYFQLNLQLKFKKNWMTEKSLWKLVLSDYICWPIEGSRTQASAPRTHRNTRTHTKESVGWKAVTYLHMNLNVAEYCFLMPSFSC